MLPPTAKYYGEQDDRHEGTLYWPGVNGLPFRGEAAPSLMKRELDKLPTVASSFERLFNMSVDEDAQYYRWVRERIRNGLFTCDFVDRWHDEHNVVWIYLEWSQLYVQQPKNIEPGSNGNGSPGNFTLRTID